MMIRRQMPAPISAGSPYMPVMTYTMACPMVMIIPKTDKNRGGKEYMLTTEEKKRLEKYLYHKILQFGKDSNCINSSRFWAPLNRALSLGVSPTSMILAPASNCIIKPDVTIGEMPNSIKVPAKEK